MAAEYEQRIAAPLVSFHVRKVAVHIPQGAAAPENPRRVGHHKHL